MLKTAQDIINEMRKLVFTETGVSIPEITIKLNGNMQFSMGSAEHIVWTNADRSRSIDEHRITLNSRAFRNRETSKVFRKIVIHEFCHIADEVINGTMNGHSRGWSQLMRMCGERPESLVSKEDIDALEYSAYRYVHSCACKNHALSLKIHRSIMSGDKHHCKSCYNDISTTFQLQ